MKHLFGLLLLFAMIVSAHERCINIPIKPKSCSTVSPYHELILRKTTNITAYLNGGPTDELMVAIYSTKSGEPLVLSYGIGVPNDSPNFDGFYTFTPAATTSLRDLVCNNLTSQDVVPSGTYIPSGYSDDICGSDISAYGFDAIDDTIVVRYSDNDCVDEYLYAVIEDLAFGTIDSKVTLCGVFDTVRRPIVTNSIWVR
jgi:hypothetical protein